MQQTSAEWLAVVTERQEYWLGDTHALPSSSKSSLLGAPSLIVLGREVIS